MHEVEKITAETPLDEKETRELIARLADPGTRPGDNRATVKDLAETLDVNVDQVIVSLQMLREDKKEKPVPEEAQKLAAALESMKQMDFKPLTEKRHFRVVWMASVLVGILMLFIAYFAFRMSEVGRIEPPRTIHTEKGP